MTANKRTFEVDRFLTRELLIRNPDNTPPSANFALVTDGRGGIYYRYVEGNTNAAGFNRITLVDSGATVNADLSFNNLNFRQGPGFKITKQDSNTIVFQATPLIPSSFYLVSTPVGYIQADNISSVVNINPFYGVNFEVSSNNLNMYGNPAFQNIDVEGVQTGVDGGTSTIRIRAESSIEGNFSTPLSSFKFRPGFAISFGVEEGNVIKINNLFSTYALNSIVFPSGSSLNFTNTYNALRLSTNGTIGISLREDNVVLFSSYAFNTISTPAGTIDAENTGIFQLSSGYGLVYSQDNNVTQIATSLPSSFNYISTPGGLIEAPFSTNILTFESDGVKIENTGPQKIKFSMTSTFARTVRINNQSTIADTANILNLSTFNDGMFVSTTGDGGAIMVGTADFNEIKIGETVSLYSRVDRKSFKLVAAPGMEITGSQLDNTITFKSVSTQGTGIVNNAFSFVRIYSTATSIGQDVTGYTTTTLVAAPESTATLNLVGVLPIRLTPNLDPDRKLFYVGLDQSTLLGPLQTSISSLISTTSSFGNQLVTSTLSVNSFSSNTIAVNSLSLSSINIGGVTNMIGVNGGNTYLTVSNVSTNSISTLVLTTNNIQASTIGLPNSTPLLKFDYVNSRVGVVVGTNVPQATLDVRGLVLAQAFATYSDASLKKFIEPVVITQSDLYALNPWHFTWLESGESDIGFSASDVEKIAPDAVKTAPSGLKMVEYSKLSVVAIAALQSLAARLTATESTLAGIRKVNL